MDCYAKTSHMLRPSISRELDPWILHKQWKPSGTLAGCLYLLLYTLYTECLFSQYAKNNKNHNWHLLMSLRKWTWHYSEINTLFVPLCLRNGSTKATGYAVCSFRWVSRGRYLKTICNKEYFSCFARHYSQLSKSREVYENILPFIWIAFNIRKYVLWVTSIYRYKYHQ